jgi:hypothetical protein
MESVLLKVTEWTGEIEYSATEPNGWLSELHIKRHPDDCNFNAEIYVGEY